jgi:hypothetical protein
MRHWKGAMRIDDARLRAHVNGVLPQAMSDAVARTIDDSEGRRGRTAASTTAPVCRGLRGRHCPRRLLHWPVELTVLPKSIVLASSTTMKRRRFKRTLQ